MNLEEFLKKYPVGTKVDFDGAYGAQCVDLFRQYCHDVWETPHLGGVVGAKDLWLNFDKMPLMKQYLERIPLEQGKAGDVVIFDASPANKFGHVAIFTGYDSNGNLRVYEQDGFAQTGVKYNTWRKNNVLGYLRKIGG